MKYFHIKYDDVVLTDNKLNIHFNGKLCEIKELHHIDNLDSSMILGNDEKLMTKVKDDIEYFKTL